MFVDFKYLDNLAIQYAEEYAHAQPFPHIVIDNFLPEQYLDAVLSEFPTPGKIDWKKYNSGTEKKLESNSEFHWGDQSRFLLYQFNSSIFINFLEKLTGIQGLIPDPHYRGGGLHQIERGGFLKIHADFNRHEKLKLDRRLNLLLYLNRNWQEEYGGHLELWDAQMTKCHHKILPTFNRCVIFSTTDFSYHGHPDPLTCPEGWTRKSLALYYYSNGRPAKEVSGGHSTLFQTRPEETFQKHQGKITPKKVVKKMLPPILLDFSKFMKTRITSKRKLN